MVKYNKEDKFYCNVCGKSYNTFYKLRHNSKPRHLKLLEKIENDKILFEINRKREIINMIEKYGMEEINRVNRTITPQPVKERRIILFKKQF